MARIVRVGDRLFAILLDHVGRARTGEWIFAPFVHLFISRDEEVTALTESPHGLLSERCDAWAERGAKRFAAAAHDTLVKDLVTCSLILFRQSIFRAWKWILRS